MSFRIDSNRRSECRRAMRSLTCAIAAVAGDRARIEDSHDGLGRRIYSSRETLRRLELEVFLKANFETVPGRDADGNEFAWIGYSEPLERISTRLPGAVLRA